jgi:hypothetical protein
VSELVEPFQELLTHTHKDLDRFGHVLQIEVPHSALEEETVTIILVMMTQKGGCAFCACTRLDECMTGHWEDQFPGL